MCVVVSSQLLQTANLLFSQSLERRRSRSSSLTSQLLLLLSDGRGVFADGTTVSTWYSGGIYSLLSALNAANTVYVLCTQTCI